MDQTQVPIGLINYCFKIFKVSYGQLFGGPPNLVEEILSFGPVVVVTIMILVLMSIISWFIIGYKMFYIARARRESSTFLDLFWQSKKLEAVFDATERLKRSPVAQAFRAGYTELVKIQKTSRQSSQNEASSANGRNSSKIDEAGFDNVERSLRRATAIEMTNLEYMTSFLATVGSTAPFIGLFGTVWGIRNAFKFIDPQQNLLETVTPYIAEALIATAFGLAAAIPAVMAYNWLNNGITRLVRDMDNFSSDFLNILKRHFF